MVWTFNTSRRRINSPLREWGEAMGAGILHNAPIIAISPYDDSLTSNLHLHRRISAQAFGRPDGQPCPSVSLILDISFGRILNLETLIFIHGEYLKVAIFRVVTIDG